MHPTQPMKGPDESPARFIYNRGLIKASPGTPDLSGSDLARPRERRSAPAIYFPPFE
jgi:hypothetical protein